MCEFYAVFILDDVFTDPSRLIRDECKAVDQLMVKFDASGYINLTLIYRDHVQMEWTARLLQRVGLLCYFVFGSLPPGEEYLVMNETSLDDLVSGTSYGTAI